MTEDFFKEILNKKLEGKSFSPTNDFDESKFYGKYLIVSKVIRPNYKNIGFSKFKGILNRTDGVIQDSLILRSIRGKYYLFLTQLI